jgi:hypothetical protein
VELLTSLFKLSLGERLLFVLMILVELLNFTKTNNNLSPKEGLNNDGQQFHQYQQNKQ